MSRLKCIDQEELFTYGGFDSNQGRAIRVQLNACTGYSYCKTKEEINEFLKFKFFFMVSN